MKDEEGHWKPLSDIVGAGALFGLDMAQSGNSSYELERCSRNITNEKISKCHRQFTVWG